MVLSPLTRRTIVGARIRLVILSAYGAGAPTAAIAKRIGISHR
jgi:hypothetical protein